MYKGENMIRKPIARFVTRMLNKNHNKEDKLDGLFIGSAFESVKDFFDPNTIYEIQHCPLSDEMIIRKVGKSMISEGSVADSPIGVTWAMEYQNVMVQAGKYALITESEYRDIQTKNG